MTRSQASATDKTTSSATLNANSKNNDTIVIPSHCVIVPFLNRMDQVARCVNALLNQLKPNSLVLLVDDGSTPDAVYSVSMQPILCHPQVYLIHHRDNYGVSAARNSGLHWCRHNNVDIVIMMDSDCLPTSKVIDEHLRLHQEHPEATCIGGSIEGRGKGLWAKLDGLTSWVHATPHIRGESFRKVNHPYHLATTNFSAKLKQLPQRDFVFDERLATGEDCLLVRELRRERKGVYYSVSPKIFHFDRETFLAVMKHHYRWGHHQYFIQLGGDISARCFNPLYRLVFFLVFLPLMPLFALLGSVLNSKPLLFNRPQALVFYPLILLLWLAKGVAVLEACLRPLECLLPARDIISYEEAMLDGEP